MAFPFLACYYYRFHPTASFFVLFFLFFFSFSFSEELAKRNSCFLLRVLGFSFVRCMLQSCVALVQGWFELIEYKKSSSSSCLFKTHVPCPMLHLHSFHIVATYSFTINSRCVVIFVGCTLPIGQNVVGDERRNKVVRKYFKYLHLGSLMDIDQRVTDTTLFWFFVITTMRGVHILWPSAATL